jgi:hypothetical protein
MGMKSAPKPKGGKHTNRKPFSPAPAKPFQKGVGGRDAGGTVMSEDNMGSGNDKAKKGV